MAPLMVCDPLFNLIFDQSLVDESKILVRKSLKCSRFQKSSIEIFSGAADSDCEKLIQRSKGNHFVKVEIRKQLEELQIRMRELMIKVKIIKIKLKCYHEKMPRCRNL